MRRLNVVHIISALPVGGVERNLVRVLPRLDREKFAVTVITTRERGDLAAEMEQAGVPVEFVYLKSRYHPVSLWRLSRSLREKRADLVHCHMRRANTSGRIAAMLAGVPVRIASERDMGLGKNWRHYLVDRTLARYTDCIMTVTRGVAEHEQRRSGIPAEKFRVLYNGLELERFATLPSRAAARRELGLPATAEVVGVIGRLHEIKNVDAVIRALADAHLRETMLCIVGDGREREKLERLARELGLAERVVFAGFRADLQNVYAALDVSVLASSSEGIANVQLEALAAGVPLVTTPVGIAAEALRAGEHYLEAARPEPEPLAEALAEALNPATAARLRETGLAAVQAFSIEAQTANLEALYLELACNKGLD